MSYINHEPAPKAKPNPHPNRTKKVEIYRGLWILIDPSENEDVARARFISRLKENNLKSGFKGAAMQRKNEELSHITGEKKEEEGQ